MALTLIVETGAGLSNANSYVSVAEADAYNDAHVSQAAWAAKTVSEKEAAVAMATRVIDESFKFSGFKTTSGQALQWPRDEVRDPDSDDSVFPKTLSHRANEFPNNEVPVIVKNATVEMARELLLTADSVSGFHQGAGIKRVKLDGFVEVEFDKTDIKKSIPRHVIFALAKVGSLIGSATVNLARA